MTFKPDGPVEQMLLGDILLVGCCIFYLLWWVLAFKPTGAVKGLRSGWLLIPAFILGIAAMLLIVQGVTNADTSCSFFSIGTVLLTGAVSYVALLIVTQLVFHRQVTTELLLIIGWTVLTFLECNALYGLQIITPNVAIGLFTATVIVAALSMVCYVLYYHLADLVGYVDGMIPLLLAGVFMAILAVFIICNKK